MSSSSTLTKNVAIKSDTPSGVPAKNFFFNYPTTNPITYFNKRGAHPSDKDKPPSIAVDFEEQKEKEKEVPAYYQKKKRKEKKTHNRVSELIKSDKFVKRSLSRKK
jgi:hypothetical protein